MNATNLFRNAVEIESIKSTLSHQNWIPSICGAQCVVDPWSIHPVTVNCERRTSPLHVVEINEGLIADLQSLVEGLSAAAVLTSLFSDKNPSKRTLGTLSVNVVFKPADPEPKDIKQQDPQSEEEDPDQLVTQSFVGNSINLLFLFLVPKTCFFRLFRIKSGGRCIPKMER